jgi:hypothetical protein
MITTLDTVKAILGINDKDVQITMLIQMVEEDYLSLRNKPFDTDENGGIVYPPGAELTAIEMIKYHLSGREAGAISETVSRRSVTYEQTLNGYPRSITKRIKRYLSFD